MTGRRGVLTCLFVLVAGCSSGPARIGPRPPHDYRIVGPAKGSACGLLLFNFIPIGVNERTRRAYDSAVAKGDGTALIDTAMRDRWYYVYIGELLCTDIQGTAIR